MTIAAAALAGRTMRGGQAAAAAPGARRPRLPHRAGAPAAAPPAAPTRSRPPARSGPAAPATIGAASRRCASRATTATPRQPRPQSRQTQRGNNDQSRPNFGDRGNNGRAFAPATGRGNPRHRGPRRDFRDFRDFHRNFNAPRRFRAPTYHRPPGWYAHRWTFGEFLPSLFWAQRLLAQRLCRLRPAAAAARHGLGARWQRRPADRPVHRRNHPGRI